MRRAVILAAALAIGLAAGNAGAQTFVSANVTVDTTWAPAPAPVGALECPIILENVVFVNNGATLTILPGCIVRGQPREGPTSGGAATAPGALAITQDGKINAVGAPNNPIVFTTAAIDNNNDGVPDVSATPPFLAQFSVGDTFYDDDPVGAPLAPLNQAGAGNVLLWGGLVILGEAPINVANNNGAVAYGTDVVEGLVLPAFPVADVTYGGVDPHDSSGSLAFASVRHAGDPILTANELNCITLGGVGDGTLLSHVECYANFDDGFEWFGGTVNADHLVANAIADDSFDTDQGFTGVTQFMFALLPHFNEDSGAPYGSPDTERAGELDGDDSDANVRLDAVDGDVDGTCWPLSNPNFWNATIIGQDPDGGNPAASPAVPAEGFHMRNGFAGKTFNSVFINFGAGEAIDLDTDVGDSACVDDSIDHANAGRIAVVSSTIADSTVPADTTIVLTNGDAICADLGAPAGLCNNAVNVPGPFPPPFPGLVNEVTGYEPKGVQAGCPGSALCGKLDVSLLASGPIDTRLGAGLTGTANGVPQGPGLDTATFRGAFGAGANWMTGSALGSATASPGWTTLSNAGMIAP